MELNDTDIKQILSKNIKSARIASNLTQENLAELADMSLNFIKEIEGCRSGISISTLINLSNALNITPNEILKDFFKDSHNKNENFIKKLDLLNDYQKNAIYMLIDYFYNNEIYN